MRKILMAAILVVAALSVGACLPLTGYDCTGYGTCDDPLVCCDGYDCYYEADGETFWCSDYDCYDAASDLSEYCWY